MTMSWTSGPKDSESIGTIAQMSPEELLASREALESLNGSWVLTHRQLIYSLPRDSSVAELLASCPNFSNLSEQLRSRLLRILVNQQQPAAAEDNHAQLREVERCLRRYRVVTQLVEFIKPMGRLKADDHDTLAKLSVDSNISVAEVAQRQLKLHFRSEHNNKDNHIVDSANSIPFPLDTCLVNPDSLRCDIHCNNDSNNNSTSIDGDKCSLMLGIQRHLEFPEPLMDSEIYRPYLNTWTPLDVSPPSSLNSSSEYERECELQCTRQRLLASVVNSLTWRQKQFRQQKLAVRLATRSALIGLKHSITAQPAKNYLELYVNMISRAVEEASLHVRRWSYNLEQSWRAFKAIAP